MVKRNRNSDEKGVANLIKAMDFCKLAGERLSQADHLLLLRILYDYAVKSIEEADLQEKIDQLLENHSDLIDEFDDLVVQLTGREKRERRRNGKQHVKADSNGCSPSYRRVRPPTNSVPGCYSHILNEEWVLKRVDIATKEKKTNKYEEILFECEDEMFEFDMEMGRLKSTFNRVEKLMEGIRTNTIELHPLSKVEEYFRFYQLSCIEQVFGLNQKIKELTDEYESTLREKWRKTFAENHPKAYPSKKREVI